ncbi:MFS transporter [Dietzia sp.]|uniref:MFS transporter n=1 Tax=Dietzia sp. TaxID=1871616 RepID=UPI002FDB06C9
MIRSRPRQRGRGRTSPESAGGATSTVGPRQRGGPLQRAAGLPLRLFTGDGARDSGLAQLAYTTVANFSIDAMLAVALANTLFFSAATAESRTNVALYLLMTVAPFAFIAPVIGPALDRMRRGRRFTLSMTFTLRAVLAVILALNFNSLLLYPCALGMLVLSKTYGVVRASCTPYLMPPKLDLVRTNARLTILGHVFGSLVAGGVAAVIAWMFDSHQVLWVLALVALVGAYLCIGLPASAEFHEGDETASLAYFHHGDDGGGAGSGSASELPAGAGDTVPLGDKPAPTRRPLRNAARARVDVLKTVLTRPLGRDVVAGLWAEASVRMLTGFMTLYVAFVAKSTEAAAATEQIAILGAAGAAAGIGTFAGNGLGARITLGHPARITLTVSGFAVAATVVAAVAGNVYAAVALSLVAALTSAIGKVALDASIQTDIPDIARSSAFGRSETALQLAWVFGGALGVLLPTDFSIGFGVLAGLTALMFGQSALTSRGRTLIPWIGGDRPRRPAAEVPAE